MKEEERSALLELEQVVVCGVLWQLPWVFPHQQCLQSTPSSREDTSGEQSALKPQHWRGTSVSAFSVQVSVLPMREAVEFFSRC